MKFHDILVQMDSFKNILKIINLSDIKNVPYISGYISLESKESYFNFKKTFEVFSISSGPSTNISKAQIIMYGGPAPSSIGSTVSNSTIPNTVSETFEIHFKFTSEKLISISIQKPINVFMIGNDSQSKPTHYVYFCGTNLFYNDKLISCIGETEALFHADLMNEEINLSEMISFKSTIDEILKQKVL